MYNNKRGFITDVEGIMVGHAQNDVSQTGVTVVLCKDPKGAVGGVDVRGSSPGTRETDLLRPTNLVTHVNAVVLAGGSAFGLESACGVMKYLKENNVGYETGFAKVPIVPSAVIYDLGCGKPDWPDMKMGYDACVNAAGGEIPVGCVGAGTGATVGKIRGMDHCAKSGVGTASIRISESVYVGAIVVVNALGDVYENEKIIAGAGFDGKYANTMEYLTKFNPAIKSDGNERIIGNTTIGVVATNAKLTKEEANKLAAISHDGLAISIRPVHTMYDGDTLFALSTDYVDMESESVFLNICAAAVEAVREAVVDAVKNA